MNIGKPISQGDGKHGYTAVSSDTRQNIFSGIILMQNDLYMKTCSKHFLMFASRHTTENLDYRGKWLQYLHKMQEHRIHKRLSQFKAK